ncbi:MAG: hypothetical protein OEM82_10230 [Acidobacteriota bacterium]|nr:hypothetical protein [Acidobacteriota bacterium]MDH3527982.1 hypothetical protein [Acidobacteriota bacterium]
MPIQIKAAVAALILSCISSLVALYFHEIEATGFGYSDSWSLGASILWVAIIMWLIWDVVKNRKDIRVTLVIVSIIMFAATALDVLAADFGLAQTFDAFEFVLWLVAFVFLNLASSKEWFGHGQVNG